MTTVMELVTWYIVANLNFVTNTYKPVILAGDFIADL